MVGLESLKRAQERVLVKLQPSYIKPLQHLDIQVPLDEHEEQQQQWSGAGLNREGKLCVLPGQRWKNHPQPFGGSQKVMSGFLMTGH